MHIGDHVCIMHTQMMGSLAPDLLPHRINLCTYVEIGTLKWPIYFDYISRPPPAY